MSNEIYSYPQLSEIITLENFPEFLTKIEDIGNKLADKLFYKSFYSSLSSSKHSGFYSLTIITPEELSLSIGGTKGVELVLNPNEDGQGSAIPIGLTYKWELIKHIANFNVAQFSGSPKAYFDVILSLFGITKYRLIEELTLVLIEADDPLQKFIDDLVAANPGSSITLNSGNSPNLFLDVAIQAFDEGINLIEHIFTEYLEGFTFEEFVDKIQLLFSRLVGNIDFGAMLSEVLVPRFSASINSIKLGVRFPENLFSPVDAGVEESLLTFDIGRAIYSSTEGFEFSEVGTVTFPESKILNSEFTLGFTNAKVDLSRKRNIPEATADGRPNDFIGVYIQDGTIGFPAFWKHDDGASTGVITARNLLVGTGGLSGRLGLESKVEGNQVPLINAKFGKDFKVTLDSFALEFKQNAIIGSDIKGTMKIPGFKDATGADAKLEIDVHIGQEGDFSVTVKEEDGILLKIPNAIQLNVKSAAVGREDDRFYLSVSGKLEIIATGLSVLGGPMDFQEIIIWDDGTYEIKGGGLELPKAIGFDGEVVKMSITSIHLGSEEREYVHSNGVDVNPNRSYKYLGLDGALKVDPGGVDAKGQGVKFYWSDDDDQAWEGRDFFLRIDSLKVDLIFPGDANPDDAMTVVKGFLSIKDAPNGMPGSEYAGGVDISMPQTGAGGAVRMRFNPKVPYFLIDAEIEPKKSIPLGNTGLGIYGFRGLVGKHFVASKTEAGVQPDEPWWKYYKAKLADSHREGVQVEKFAPEGGFAVGLGVSLATSTDGGKVFSSKIFMLLSLRELFMLQGQAAILKERIKLSDPNDPPFFALIVISKESIEAALGVNYNIGDDKDPGAIATVQGVLELGFFFQDASAWYLNVGRDLPESYRILVWALRKFDCYFYFMLNAKGIRTGAGASFDAEIDKGPLYAHLWAYIDIAAKVAFKPKQFGGSIQLGGGIDISIFGIGFGISAAAGLAAEAPEPFNISGFVKACFQLMGKEWCAEFEFSWEFNDTIDRTAIGVINGNDGLASMAQALNIQTREVFPVQVNANGNINPPAPASWAVSFDDHIVPMDSFIDLDFTNGMNPFGNASTDKFGTLNGGANHYKSVAPQKGKSPQVHHSFHVEEIYVRYWDGANWVDYDVYSAMTEWVDPNPTTQPAYSSMDLKQGYWQSESPNQYNKLRVLAQNPLSFTTVGSRLFVPENSGITSQSIFCDPEERVKTCINFVNYIPTRKTETTDYTGDFSLTGLPPAGNVSSLQMYNNAYPTEFLGAINDGSLYSFGEVAFVVNGGDAGIITAPQTIGSNSIGLGMLQNNSLEITFNEPMVCIDYGLTTYTNEIIVEFYRIVIDPNGTGNNVMEELITSVTHSEATVNAAEQQYLDPANPVDKMIIRSGENPEGETFGPYCEPELTLEGEYLEAFFDALIQNGDLMNINFQLNDATHNPLYDGVFMNSPLYQWQGGGSAPDLDYSLVITGNYLTITISDGVDYNCVFKLEPGGRFDWANVTGFTNLRKDPNNSGVGPNYSFIIDAQLNGGGTSTMPGSSTCHNVLNCYNDLTTWVFNVCHLSAEDYALNQTVLNSSQTTAQVNSMMDAMQYTIQPIWRPETDFAVTIKVREDITGASSEYGYYHVGFRTAGPIGHFHRYMDGPTEVIRDDYLKLQAIDQEESYALSNLKSYVNYEKSYPNANGDLLNAKPLFYLDPKINLFFNNPYVYHMFDNWDEYGTSTVEHTGAMDVEIVDPAQDTEGAYPGSTVRWQRDQNPIQNRDSQILGNMIANAGQGGCEPAQLNEQGVMAEIELNNLKPLKLYTAKIRNNFNGTIREVLKYPFRTSRYGTFQDQIESYILAYDGGTPTKTAIYDVTLDSQLDLTEASEVIGGDPIYQKNYPDTIERILQGTLKVGTLQPAISTEFNILRYNTNVAGVWIRCPEPFNDPKIPQADLALTVELTVNGGGTFKTFISKDVREVLITNDALNMGTGSYAFTFKYLQWNKDTMQYEAVDTQVVNHTVPSI